MDQYRLILSELNVVYKKQGHGTLQAHSQIPEVISEEVDGARFVDMVTTIKDKDGNEVSTSHTRWQIKKWENCRN